MAPSASLGKSVSGGLHRRQHRATAGSTSPAPGQLHLPVTLHASAGSISGGLHRPRIVPVVPCRSSALLCAGRRKLRTCLSPAVASRSLSYNSYQYQVRACFPLPSSPTRSIELLTKRTMHCALVIIICVINEKDNALCRNHCQKFLL